MISISSAEKLKNIIRSEHSSWSESAIDKYAVDLINNCDKRLEEVINKYISQNVESDFSHGEFSIFLIRAMRHNCGFMDAVLMMDAYLKDPLRGKAMILRR